ncbi:MAG: FmdB family zinc ribbon protein [Candidatus Dormibacteria bacterium]
MPTYGYRCSTCPTEFDVVERMADEPNGHCPVCGSPGTRLFYPVGIVFKGTGFYKTDSRSDSRATSDRAPGDGDAEQPAATAPAEKPGATTPSAPEGVPVPATDKSGKAAEQPGKGATQPRNAPPQPPKTKSGQPAN